MPSPRCNRKPYPLFHWATDIRESSFPPPPFSLAVKSWEARSLPTVGEAAASSDEQHNKAISGLLLPPPVKTQSLASVVTLLLLYLHVVPPSEASGSHLYSFLVCAIWLLLLLPASVAFLLTAAASVTKWVAKGGHFRVKYMVRAREDYWLEVWRTTMAANDGGCHFCRVPPPPTTWEVAVGVFMGWCLSVILVLENYEVEWVFVWPENTHHHREVVAAAVSRHQPPPLEVAVCSARSSGTLLGQNT